MSGVPFEKKNSDLRKAPKGKLPFIEDEGKIVADSTFIRWHLEKKYRIDLDRGLDAEQRAIAWAFEKMLEELDVGRDDLVADAQSFATTALAAASSTGRPATAPPAVVCPIPVG